LKTLIELSKVVVCICFLPFLEVVKVIAKAIVFSVIVPSARVVVVIIGAVVKTYLVPVKVRIGSVIARSWRCLSCQLLAERTAGLVGVTYL
jgi:hypothetical protein